MLAFFLDNLWLTYSSLVVLVLINIGVTYSMYIPMLCGRMSLAPVGFMLIGAYTAGKLTKHGVAVPLALLAAIGISIAIAAAFGPIVLRLRGDYFTVATLAFVIVANQLATVWTSFTGGGTGLNNIPVVIDWKEALIFAVVIAFIVASLDWSRIGKAWRAAGGDERIAAAIGVNVGLYQQAAFVLSAAIAALGGGLYALTLPYIDPTFLSFGQVLNFLAFAVLGGIGNFAGPIVGAAILTAAPSLLLSVGTTRDAVIGVVLVAVVLLAPRGLADARTWKTAYRALRRAIPVGRMALAPAAEGGNELDVARATPYERKDG
jgi:branched-chain amino acid transport system permease protein